MRDRFTASMFVGLLVLIALPMALPMVLSQTVYQTTGGAFSPRVSYDIQEPWLYSGSLSPWVIEGATDDQFEGTWTFGEPTADVTYTMFNATDQVVGRATTDTLTNKTLTAPTLTAVTITGTSTIANGMTITTPVITSPNVTTTVLTAAGGTETLTSTDCGQSTLLDTAAGSVVTLQAATGTGCILTFLTTVGVTSNTHDIVVVGTDEFVGSVRVMSTTVANSDVFLALPAGDNDTIQMDGDTEGGDTGTVITLVDVASGDWFVIGQLNGVGATPTTPFLTGQVS